MKKSAKSPNDATNALSELVSTCERELHDLLKNRGLETVTSGRSGMEFWVRFSGDDKEVYIYFEPFCCLEVRISVRRKGRLVNKGLHQVVRKLGLGDVKRLVVSPPPGLICDLSPIPFCRELFEKHWDELFSAV